MDSVNRVIKWVAIPILVIFYLFYLIYDWKNQRGSDWRYDFEKKKETQLIGNKVDAFFLGGSNVAYSLSAVKMSKLTGINWFNFGISSEGFSDENYWYLVRTSLTDEQRQAVSNIVYSSVATLRNGHIKGRREENSDAYGRRPFGIIPNIALLVKIKQLYLNESDPYESKKYPLPIDRGDFNFSQKKCPIKIDNSVSFFRESDAKLMKFWLNKQINEMESIFPNATIFVVQPSEFYDKSFSQQADNFVVTTQKNVVNNFKNASKKVFFIKQPPYPKLDYVCDYIHHSNLKGRSWRTQNLYDQLKPYF